MLYILDAHAQTLIHATTHCTYLAVARNTLRATAIVFAYHTHYLDKTLADIALLRNEVDEPWRWS
jgi:hypothetical protein